MSACEKFRQGLAAYAEKWADERVDVREIIRDFDELHQSSQENTGDKCSHQTTYTSPKFYTVSFQIITGYFGPKLKRQTMTVAAYGEGTARAIAEHYAHNAGYEVVDNTMIIALRNPMEGIVGKVH